MLNKRGGGGCTFFYRCGMAVSGDTCGTAASGDQCAMVGFGDRGWTSLDSDTALSSMLSLVSQLLLLLSSLV